MGQKDLTQKNLEHYPDVFVDTINALLYEGKRMLQPGRLQTAPTETLYHIKNGCLRNQLQDVSKYEMQEGQIKLQYTVENETSPDSRLILRKAGYEGAVYREQYDRKTKETYPVISIVLYWGKGRRRIARSIYELFGKKKLPREVMRYIADEELYVYDMRNLPKEIRERFQSDMRIVVDYLAEGKDYQPTRQPILHPREFLLLMREITEDARYEQFLEQVEEEQNGKGGITMCELLDKYINQGIEQGLEQGMKQGIEQGLEQGESKLASLISRLLADGRTGDVQRAACDKGARMAFYREYGMA